MGLKIAVLVGSVRSDRQGIKAARFVERSLAARGHAITLVDPVALHLPLLDRMYKEYPAGQAPETLERLAKLIKSSDAVIVVSGEYNHSIQPALSNLLGAALTGLDAVHLLELDGLNLSVTTQAKNALSETTNAASASSTGTPSHHVTGGRSTRSTAEGRSASHNATPTATATIASAQMR